MIFLALLLQAFAPPGTTQCGVINAGPGEGLCLGPAITKPDAEGFEIRSFLLGPDPEPPLAADLDLPVRAALESYERRQALPAGILLPDATDIFCAQGDYGEGCLTPKPLKTWSLKAGYRPAAPHLMSDGSVRIAWIKAGKVAYLTVITLAGGKVAAMRTLPAEVAYHP